MKRFFKQFLLVVLISITISLLCMTVSATSSESILGDMNGDSVVDRNDAIYLLKHTMLPSRYPIDQSADVDGTGDVNIDDAIYLWNHISSPSEYPLTSDPGYTETTCTACRGVGSVTSTGQCTTCGGKGVVTKTTYGKDICTTCNGIGGKRTNCSYCKGFGKIGTCTCSCGNTWSPNKTGSRVCSKCGKSVAMDVTANCGFCQGTGGTTSTCYRCNGTGQMVIEEYTSSTCSSCNGSGSVTGTTTCSTCNGNKTIISYHTYKVTLMDGETTVTTASVTFNSAYELIIPQKSGFTFMGWFDAAENGTQYTDANGASRSVWSNCGNKILYAQWKRNCDVTLTQDLPEAGTVSGSGNYPYGASVTVTATANTEYTFLGWYEGETKVSADASYTFTVSEDRSLEARWQINSYTVSVSQNIAEAGSVSGGGSYEYGTSATVQATTNTGYTFLGWYEDETKVSADASYTFTVSGAGSIEARWQINSHTVSVSQNIADAGSVSGGGSYEYGTSATVQATTNTGYTFLGWYEDGALVSSDASYTFTVSGACSLEARWQINSYTVSVSKNIADAGSVSGGGSYEYGTSATVQATTNTGYTFLGWYEDGALVSSDASYTFTVSGAGSLEARWQIDHYTVTFVTNGGFEMAAQTLPYGDNISNVIPTRDGYTFGGWFSSAELSVPVTTVPAYDVTVFAYWNEESKPCDFSYYGTTGISISKYAGNDTTVHIPAYIGGIPVVGIGSAAFSRCSKLTSITIPDSITKIGVQAFYGCSKLKSITIPNSVTSINGSIFQNCSSLTSITIPDSVTNIGNYAFYNCSKLTSITIPDSVTSIGSDAFSGCPIETATIPSIACEAVQNSKLTTVVITSGESIENNTFSGCTHLMNITIPNGVTSIGQSAFSDCSSLTSITIPDSVTSIGQSAFSGCSSLTSITIPNSVTIIGYNALDSCSSLINITVDPENSRYHSSGNCLIETNSKTLVAGCANSAIPADGSVTGIGFSAFKGCTSLASITIPNSVTSIGSGAFSGCSSLTSITIPNSVTSIGSGAFSGCSSLAIITIPDSITSIDPSTFEDCKNLTSITIPSSVTSIGYAAFAGCTSLMSITIPSSVTSVGYNAFKGCTGLSNIAIPDSTTSIDSSTFQGCKNLTSITIPNSVTSIGEWAFNGCSSLTSITIPNSVTSIGKNAFSGCSSLTNVTIGNNVTSIGEWAFNGCSSLTSITIPDSVTSLGSYAFKDCTNLVNVTIGNGVTSIGSYTFYWCTNLTSVTIGNGVTNIGKGAFNVCSRLTSITIPNGVTSIDSEAFQSCTSLTSIKYRGTYAQWSAITKGSNWDMDTGSYTITYDYTGE